MEVMNNVWAEIQPYITSGAFATLMTTIICGFIKGFIDRKLKKVNLEDLFARTNKNALEHIKGMTFKHDIQPLVDKSLLKIKAEITEGVQDEFLRLNDIITKQTKVIGAFMSYFDNASGITQETRDNAKALLADTFTALENKEIVESEVVYEEDTKKKEKKATIER